MRRVLPYIFVAGLAAALTGASAQTTPATGTTPPAATTTPAPADAAAPAQSSDDIVSCRYEKMTGSLFSKRICHTQREWRQMSEDARDAMDRLNGGASGGDIRQ